MLVSQHLNETIFPLYGCYITGRNWFFVVLSQNEYAVSPAYDATKIAELHQIDGILWQAKQYVEQYLDN